MQQTLAILRKDVRFLRLPVALALALTASFAWSFCVDGSDLPRGPFTMVLILTWYALAAAAILKERPAGENQFWTTRPYRPSSLLAAKALFLVAFIHVPLLAADLAILAAQRFAPSPATLLWRQFGLAALVTLPAAAIAALTANFGAMAAASVAALGTSIALLTTLDSMRQSGLFDEWLRGALILAFLFLGAAATVVWQYRRRHTAIAIGLAASGFALAMVAAATPFYAPLRTPAEPANLRSVHLFAEPMSALNPGIHLRIKGVPAGMRPNADAIAVSYRGQGVPWDSGWRPRFGSQAAPISWNSDSDPAAITIYPAVGERGRVHVTVLISIHGAVTAELLSPDGRPRDTAIGRCDAAPDIRARALNLFCRNSHYPALLAEFDGAQVHTAPGLYFEYLNASPVVEFRMYKTVHDPRAPVTLVTAPLVGRVRREIEIPLEARR